MEVTPQQVLGDFFSNREFPEDQKTRIATAVSSRGSACARVLGTYATKTELYLKGFEKNERIAGARAGTHFYRTRALVRIREWLSNSNPRAWKIYKEAAILYIEKELTALNTLLAEVPVPSDDVTVADALRSVCSHAGEFGVSREHILRFLDVWGVDRVDNFESVVDDWLKPDEAAESRRQIAALKRQVSALAASVGDAGSETSALRQLVTNALRDISEARSAQTKFGDAQHRLAEAAASTAQMVDLHDAKLEPLEDGFRRLSDMVAALRRESVTTSVLKAEIERLEVSGKAAITLGTDTTRSALESAFREELAVAKDSLERKLSQLSTELLSSIGNSSRADPPRYRSPLTQVSPCAGPRPNVSAEVEFVRAFVRRLHTEHQLDIGFELAVAYHRGFLANRVIVADWPLVKAWLDCLEWHAFTVHLAANPTWSGEDHWADGAEHLFQPGSSPRFTVIHNFDAGIIDYYLSPSLSLWHRQQPAEPCAKLLLVPSGGEWLLTPLLAEHAFVCTGEPRRLQRTLSLRDGVKPAPTPPGEPASGVDPAAMLSWAHHPGPPPADLNRDLHRIQERLPCCISTGLAANVRRTCSYLRTYLTDASAAGFALDCHIAPWVHATYSGEKDSDLSAIVAPLRSVAK